MSQSDNLAIHEEDAARLLLVQAQGEIRGDERLAGAASGGIDGNNPRTFAHRDTLHRSRVIS